MTHFKTEELDSRKGVYVKTFGCQVNEYDTEKMLMLLSEEYKRVLTPEEAEVILINTCSVREKAEHKLHGLLGRLKPLKETNPELVIGVGGCVAQQEGNNIIKRNKLVDFVVGTHNISLVPSLVKNSKIDRTPQVAVDYRDEWEELPDRFDAMPDESYIVKSTFNSSVRALVAIQRGCDKMCTYCVVPGTRGKQVSRDPKEILKEINLKVRMGAREVLLLGQTVNSYGVDLNPRVKFSKLIQEISEIPNVKRIRFISPHPAEVKKDFIDLYKKIPSLCPHIHLPLQSGSDRILGLMNRSYKTSRYLQIVEELKEKCPNIAITTDIIIGFPTETEEDFLETLEVVKKVKYHSVFSFKYSKRPKTSALEFHDDQEIQEEIKQNRLVRLQELVGEHALSHNKSYLNKEIEVLVESTLENIYKGRSQENVHVEFFKDEGQTLDIKMGDIIKVKVLRASPHGLKGTC